MFEWVISGGSAALRGLPSLAIAASTFAPSLLVVSFVLSPSLSDADFPVVYMTSLVFISFASAGAILGILTAAVLRFRTHARGHALLGAVLPIVSFGTLALLGLIPGISPLAVLVGAMCVVAVLSIAAEAFMSRMLRWREA
jgi:hypothetical protein